MMSSTYTVPRRGGLVHEDMDTLEELSQQYLVPSPGVSLKVSGELRFDAANP